MNTPEPPSFTRLRVWQSALDLADAVYRETSHFPPSERFGITSQMRRCAVSVVATIAEGHGRFGARSFAFFLNVAIGSVRELQSLLILSERLGLLTADVAERLGTSASGTCGQLVNLAKHLRRK